MTDNPTAQPNQTYAQLIASAVRNMSIKRKLVSVIMVTCVVALSLAGAVFIAWQWAGLRLAMVQNLSTHAEILANNCKAALTFDDARDATETLNSFDSVPSILVAAVYNKKGELLAAYSRPGSQTAIRPQDMQKDGHVFEGNFLTVFKSVVLDEETIGTACIRADLTGMYVTLKRNVQVIIAVLLLSCLAAYIFSARLQRIISAPILNLADVAKRVSEKREYSARAFKHGNDEIGLLIDAFNDMLEQIQQRDSALVAANEKLEARVQERTGELTSANEQLTREVTYRKKAEQLLKQRTERIIRHQSTLLRLGKMAKADLNATLKVTTEEDAKTLGVERVGIWFFNNDKSQLLCRDLYRLSQNAHESGLTVDVNSHPKYFETMESSRILAAKDVLNDPRTNEFGKDYLGGLGVTSMMDVPIRLHGRMVGAICHEHIGLPREWTLEEQDFAASIADTISLQLEAEERRKAEEALERANKNLAETVRELRRSNKELQDFAYITAHDLKAPLRAIGTLTDWISSDYGEKFDEPGKQQLHLLKGRVTRMSQLIDSILRYSEIGRVARQFERVDLDVLMAEVITQIAPPDDIEIIIQDQMPTLFCERVRLFQIFQNLIGNAVKYMDKPAGRITVTCSEETGFWKFGVADNGPGIEEKYFEKVFKIFQTLIRRDEFESTGMGLAIVKKIVELYGGTTWVESKVGQGSTFFFTLPKQQVQAKTEELQTAVID